ncbi:MAG: amino acid-binding ACT domain protein [Candidatus Micrarchaeota archaeon]
MYPALEEAFTRFPVRREVIEAMLRYGLSVSSNGNIFCGEIELAPAKIGRALKCDRRVVIDTAKMIAGDEKLFEIFSALKPTADIRGAAKKLGFDVIEVRANPNSVGIVADISRAIAKEGISIRQIIADDPEIYPDPKLTLVLNAHLPSEALERLRKVKGLERISLG